MDTLALYCKSYHQDVQRVKVLLDSIIRFNKDRIPFYISVPKEDIKLFQNTLSTDGHTLIEDELIISLNQSWRNQQIVKSRFWTLDKSANYVMLDSDSYFIRNFYEKDFIHHGTTPYTVMHEQKDLFSWIAKNHSVLGFDPQSSFAEAREPIQTLFDRVGRLYDFGPSPVVWSNEVWNTLEQEYIKANDLTFEGLINTVASEFSWYGEWLLVRKPIEIWPIEPIFKVFHFMPQYIEYKQLGYTEEHWARNYLGVCMQSSSGLPLKY